jgi:NADH-quinone oxidoreductase subunit A
MDSTLLWPFLVYVVLVVGMVSGMLVTAWVLAPPRRRERATGEVYESGLLPVGDTHARHAFSYWLVGVFFVMFDLEAVFFYSWSISVRELGWRGLAAVSGFAGVLLVALVYLWRNGALERIAHHRRKLDGAP